MLDRTAVRRGLVTSIHLSGMPDGETLVFMPAGTADCAGAAFAVASRGAVVVNGEVAVSFSFVGVYKLCRTRLPSPTLDAHFVLVPHVRVSVDDAPPPSPPPSTPPTPPPPPPTPTTSAPPLNALTSPPSSTPMAETPSSSLSETAAGAQTTMLMVIALCVSLACSTLVGCSGLLLVCQRRMRKKRKQRQSEAGIDMRAAGHQPAYGNTLHATQTVVGSPMVLLSEAPQSLHPAPAHGGIWSAALPTPPAAPQLTTTTTAAAAANTAAITAPTPGSGSAQSSSCAPRDMPSARTHHTSARIVMEEDDVADPVAVVSRPPSDRPPSRRATGRGATLASSISSEASAEQAAARTRLREAARAADLEAQQEAQRRAAAEVEALREEAKREAQACLQEAEAEAAIVLRRAEQEARRARRLQRGARLHPASGQSAYLEPVRLPAPAAAVQAERRVHVAERRVQRRSSSPLAPPLGRLGSGDEATAGDEEPEHVRAAERERHGEREAEPKLRVDA